MTASERAPTLVALVMRGNALAASLTAAAAAVALAAAWVWPAVAMAVVWPLLCVVPGWLLVAWTRPRIAATGRLGLAIVLSVAIAAHLVYWVSLLLGGYDRATIFLASGLLLVPVVVTVWRSGLVPVRAQLRSGRRALRRNSVPFAVAALSAAFVGLVLDSSLWHPTQGGVTAGGSNWSDLGVHLSIAQSVNAGNFPPQVPYFAGAPLVYHWFADFHAAIAAEAAGLFAIPAFVSSSAILAGALPLLVHGLAMTLLRGRNARRAALIAALLVIFGGGLAWMRFAGDLWNGVGDPVTLVTNNSYDNSWYDAEHGESVWPYFRIPSVMGTGLLVHRATTFGLPILVGAVLLLVAGLPTRGAYARGSRDRPALLVLAGLLGALLAPFHFFFFPAFALIALLYVVIGGRLFDRDAPRNAAFLLAPYVLAAPFVAAPLLNASGSGALKPAWGWESAPMADGPLAVAFFYVTNLGVPFLLAIGALFVRDLRARAFLGAWALALFLVPNVMQVSDVAFDMNKYFQAMWIAVALLAAWLIRRWPWPAVVAVFLLSVPSPLLIAAYTAFDHHNQVLDRNSLQAADWIAANTPDKSVFVTDGWLNSPTDPAGRLRLLTYTPYIANLGFNPHERAAQVRQMYCAGDLGRTVELMRQLGAGYLIESGRPEGCEAPTEFVEGPLVHKVFENDALRIWQLVGADLARGDPG